MRIGRAVLVLLVALASGLFLFPQKASADIVEVESATSCPGSVGGGLCNGLVPFDLQAFLTSGVTIGVVGTQKYIVTDTMGSFTIIYTGSSGDNGSCQINGGTTAFFSTCVGKNGDGTGFSLGHDDTVHPGMNSPTTITFTAKAGQCTPTNPCTFDLGFVSWQGTGTIAPPTVPEPGTLGLLGIGLLFVGGAIRRRILA